MPEKALPQSLEVGEGNIRLIRFPSLVDEGSSVSVRLFADEHQAGLAHSRGVVKLVMLNSLQQRNMLRKQFDRFVKQNALKLPVGSADFAEQCVEACYVEALGSVKTVRSREALEQVLQSAKSQVVGIGDRLVALLERIIVIRLTLKKRLSALSSAPGYLTSDVASQLERLFGPKFVAESGSGDLRITPDTWMRSSFAWVKPHLWGPKIKSIQSSWLATGKN